MCVTKCEACPTLTFAMSKDPTPRATREKRRIVVKAPDS